MKPLEKYWTKLLGCGPLQVVWLLVMRGVTCSLRFRKLLMMLRTSVKESIGVHMSNLNPITISG
jgi:hypothetical protein